MALVIDSSSRVECKIDEGYHVGIRFQTTTFKRWNQKYIAKLGKPIQLIGFVSIIDGFKNIKLVRGFKTKN